jgi:hypothetical protein
MAAPLSKWITIGLPLLVAAALVLLLLGLVAWRVRRVSRRKRMPADEPRL